MVDDYELLPHEELEKLRRDIEHLKKSPYPGTKQNKNLLDSMESLSDSINRLIAIFEGTQEDLIKEYKDASPTKLLVKVSEQNVKIAEGIVAVAEMLKNNKPMSPIGPLPGRSMPSPQSMPPPSMNNPGQMPPPNMPPPPEMDGLKVPDADLRPEKKGLFSKFRK